jgi:uncharacterized protein (TIGR03086 family)
MSDTMGKYTTALDGFERVVRAVPADRWESASPCTGWAAIDVAGHVTGGLHMLRILATGGTLEGERPSNRHLAGADPVASFGSARAAAVPTLTAEALATVVPGPAGEMPLGLLIDTIMTGEVMLHTWDLARAAGVDVELDPAMAEEMLARWEPMDGPELRNPQVFGPRLTAPDGASSGDRLLAFSGRQV